MLSFNKNIKLGNFNLSDTSPTFIIAEAGVNHNRDMKLAKELIHAAIETKVNAIKFQTFKSENVVLKGVEKAAYQKITTGTRQSQLEMLKELELNVEETLELKEYCQKQGIFFLTTVGEEESFNAIKTSLEAYKASSSDFLNIPYIKNIARQNKPVILSTGMCYLSEVRIVLQEVHKHNKDIILLQCTANYPITDNEANLAVINTFKQNFDMITGYSDHSSGVGAAPYAVAMGAKVIEKHFTIDKTLKGPDHKASLNPAELKEMVNQIRKVEEYSGNGLKVPTLGETTTRASLPKRLVAKKNIKKGELIKEEHLIAKRTGGVGLLPFYYKNLINTQAKQNFEEDDIIVI